MPVIPVTHSGTTYALFVCGQPAVDGAEGPERSRGAKFFTEQSDEFQVGVFERPTGYEVKPHAHPPIDRTIHRQSEFLFVQTGAVRIAVFDEEWSELAAYELHAGDFAVFLRGGHALTMLEPTRLIEVKQGPYPGENNAKMFKPSPSTP